MRRVLTVLAAFALATMLNFVAMTIDLSLHGAYVTDSIERFPGAVAVVVIGSAITQIGLLVLLGATILGLTLSGQRHQWGWLLLILLLFPVAVASMLATGFVPHVAPALLTLLSPLVLLLYSLRAHAARASAIAA